MTQNNENSFPPVESSRCPFCFGSIAPEARKCRHCGEWIDTVHAKNQNQQTNQNKTTEMAVDDNFGIPNGFPAFSAYWGYFCALINTISAIITMSAAHGDDRAIVFFVYVLPSVVIAYFLFVAPSKKYSAPYGIVAACTLLWSIIVTTMVVQLPHPEDYLVGAVIGAWLAFLLSTIAYRKARRFLSSDKNIKTVKSNKFNDDTQLPDQKWLPSAEEIARVRAKAQKK